MYLMGGLATVTAHCPRLATPPLPSPRHTAIALALAISTAIVLALAIATAIALHDALPNKTVTTPSMAPKLSLASTVKLNSGYEMPLLGFGVSAPASRVPPRRR